ncbi:hypothetical protein ACV342_33815, partial [Pseudomonas aeruginosa]
MILGTSKADWLAEFPRLADLIALRPSEWFNPAIAPSAEALADVGLGAMAGLNHSLGRRAMRSA